jgi:hypothetical protein
MHHDAEVPPNFSVQPVRSVVGTMAPRRPDDGVTASMHAPGSLPSEATHTRARAHTHTQHDTHTHPQKRK